VSEQRLISLRLDAEARRALETLMSSGRTRSEAIRQALIDAAARRRRAELAAEAEAIAADPDDRAEIEEVAALMESLREKG
jgi:Arc/MetJ-type ribon-helix-helix transcriptional regulator